ncbi:MAG: GNAT family N-acetyltransferase [Hydrogenophaga sp.]|jgi:GNAT superfamily N-acetyltransferase|uniref:GNAT family N-acetyltransferase n=1 Tax=Hydrogenophaga sp. TaxID=1904254 RepID=UPI0025BC15B3|nr:GNAT family N-acetyltransferase [Hydrogenophaga sp.]MDO9131933.1 GNAT family N-acetyltransferase [Hydrogenophaga sp.]MDO9504638.1 GNAT family N-acetyltransferase [Hydrogenophaga sp.]MDP2252318.1 GNAT family N-acetyltransferase [Hydrogenophaga sp.]MDP2987662.1 GNAT family N-acetyltransferase [Hydrogenophaga sp.]MDP3627574.1 GNAT family N-acetyltransferase [Hydrogenophaga sp.]
MNIHAGYLPGCIGRVVEMHAAYYAHTVGFGVAFEAKVATELAAFCLHIDSTRDGLWLARDDDGIQGSVVIDGTHHEEAGAHLRWFITSDASRGQGVGAQLLEAAMAFCRARGYRKVYLWTFDELHAARHLYEKHGFALARTQRGSQWGKEVNEQLFTFGGP